MTLSDTTALIVGTIAALLIAYDVWVKWKDPTGDSTISWVIRTAAMRWPIIATAIGVLVGHFFWPNCPDCPPK